MARLVFVKRKYLCRRCREKVIWVSSHHLCLDCVNEAVKDNVRQLKTKKGANWEKWKQNMANFLNKPEGEE